jgi:hypothetical protein
MLVEAYIISGEVETALSELRVMQDSKLYSNSGTTRALFRYLSKSPDQPKEFSKAFEHCNIWEERTNGRTELCNERCHFPSRPGTHCRISQTPS